MRVTMTIPALGLMEFMHVMEFPVPIYGKDWAKPARMVDRSELYTLINGGLVMGLGSRSRLRRIHMVDLDNFSAISYSRQHKTKNKLKFPIKSDAGSTTIHERLQHGVIVQHHHDRCDAWPHTGGAK
jgi:hypothetical protein